MVAGRCEANCRQSEPVASRVSQGRTRGAGGTHASGATAGPYCTPERDARICRKCAFTAAHKSAGQRKSFVASIVDRIPARANAPFAKVDHGPAAIRELSL